MKILDAFLLEFGGAILRWLHVITAIAWIGASFFFMHLDATIRQAKDIPAGEGGEAWQVHGGGFYQMRKFYVAPAFLPEELTWHKWQAYWTWISGFLLLVWVYYAQASLYLISPDVLDLSPLHASIIGIVALAFGWVVYDQLCRSVIGKNEKLLAIVGFGFVVAMSYVFTLVFSARGAMVHTGALMATIMAANVAMVIMPNTRKSVASLKAKEKPDPRYAYEAKQRSSHNNYITLPVLFLMLSNHYPVFWSNSAVLPVVVALVIVAGAMIRHFYNVRHTDHKKSPWWAWGVSGAALAAAFVIAMIASPGGRDRFGLAALPQPVEVAYTRPPDHVVEIVTSRCSMCHMPAPVWEGLSSPPKGVMLDTPLRIAAQANAIRMQAVLTHAMPPNNVTELPLDERRQIADWLNK